MFRCVYVAEVVYHNKSGIRICFNILANKTNAGTNPSLSCGKNKQKTFYCKQFLNLILHIMFFQIAVMIITLSAQLQ